MLFKKLRRERGLADFCRGRHYAYFEFVCIVSVFELPNSSLCHRVGAID